MWAGTDRRNNGIVRSGTVTIGGNALYSAPIVTLPAEEMNHVMKSSPPLTIEGLFDYCDNLGNYSCRKFNITYMREPYNRFLLSLEVECDAFETKLRSKDSNIDYFPACEVTKRERAMEEKAQTQ